jgi:hypothetical protein
MNDDGNHIIDDFLLIIGFHLIHNEQLSAIGAEEIRQQIDPKAGNTVLIFDDHGFDRMGLTVL